MPYKKSCWLVIGNSPALRLQRGVNIISLQCITWPAVACSEWGACFTYIYNFAFRFWGQMTPKVKIFPKCFCWFIDGTPNYVSWPNWWKSTVAKLPKGRVVYQTQNNSGSAWLVPAPILAKMGRSRPKFPERRHPLTCPRIPNLVWIGCILPDLFRKDWFFGPKSQYNAFNLQKHYDILR